MAQTILLVDDDDDVRKLCGRLLRGRGYEVIEAASGEDAQEVVAHRGGHVDLLISDVTMTGISGPQLGAQLVTEMPDLQLIYMSGYPDADVNGRATFLAKPFSPARM